MSSWSATANQLKDWSSRRLFNPMTVLDGNKGTLFAYLYRMIWTFPFCRLLAFSFFLLVAAGAKAQAQEPSGAAEVYQCLPCGTECDAAEYRQPGKCAHCQMALVKKSTIRHRSISPDSVCNYLKEHPDVVLLDVRTKEEFEGRANPDFGTLKNAINIPVQELEQRLSELAGVKNKTILVYCARSRRSPRASYLLTQNGFTEVINMEGGMSAFTDAECKK